VITSLESQLKEGNDIGLRNYYESLRSWLSNERGTWTEHWKDLARFMLPRSPRFNYEGVDNGTRKDFSLIDNTATMCLRTLGAGLLSGMSSPTRKWFFLRAEDDDLNEQDDVKAWFEACEEVIARTMIKTNCYQTLFTAYREEGLYGTTAFLVLEDEKDDARCYPYPIGSYYLSGDSSLRVDFCMRILNMTARQMVDRFGYDNVSSAIKNYFDNNSGGSKEQWWPIVHVVHKNTYFERRTKSSELPWLSVYYELNTYNSQQGLLQKSGFEEFPVIAGRWDVTGEDFYGNSPGMDCLGDTMALQLQQKRKQQAIDKQVNPPMVASSALMGSKLSILPGDVTFADTRDGSPGFKPAFQINYDLQWAQQDIKETQQRIRSALYTDLFLMISGSDRREVTAEEIRARQEEKMQVLGPVLERNNDEVLRPLVLRFFNILYRRGKLPPMPEVLSKKPFKVEFASILSQVQKLSEIGNINQLMAFIGNQAAINPSALDIIDSDAMNEKYADLLSVPQTMIRSPEDRAAIREQRAKQQQQAAMAEQAKNLSGAAQTLSQTDLRSDSALSRLLGSAGQGGL
jgi:hypothetical protein